MDIPAAVATLVTAVGLVRDLREIDTGLDKAEMKARLAEVINSLADVKMALVDVQDDSRAKDAENYPPESQLCHQS